MADASARECVKRVSFPPKTLATMGIVSIISIAVASNYLRDLNESG